jgi:hypothetical protein
MLGKEMDLLQGKVCISDTRKQIGGKLVDCSIFIFIT